MRSRLLLFSIAILTIACGSPQESRAGKVDVLFIVDESGSMGGEHAWLGGMVSTLDSNLAAAGVTDAVYGLAGFGGRNAHLSGHKHLVGGGDFGTAAEFATAAGTLTASGSREDGWQAMHFALDNYAFRQGAALNVILVTDEDRDNRNSALTYANTLAKLQSKDAVLNAVVNASWNPGRVLGVTGYQNGDADTGYLADGSGGFTTFQDPTFQGDSGSTLQHYSEMAFDTGGASWDLNNLREGGGTATSFTNAFIDVKVREITSQIVPEPTSMALLGIGLPALLGCGLRGRKKKTRLTQAA